MLEGGDAVSQMTGQALAANSRHTVLLMIKHARLV